MAPPLSALAISLLLIATALLFSPTVATWCVARSDATNAALKAALDYACGSGADCAPIQAEGLCFLPNTMQAHASYAYNSYYQRKGNAPGSCDFSGTATVAKTDPSYGSCVYPASASQAGGTGAGAGAGAGAGTGTGTGTGAGSGTGTGTTTPSFNIPPPPGTVVPLYGNGGLTPGFAPGMGTPDSITSNSRKAWEISLITLGGYVFCVLSFVFYVPT